MRGFIALIGPPGAGKSTVTGQLTAEHDACCFRLREFSHTARQHSLLPWHLFGTADAHGRLAEPAVASDCLDAFQESVWRLSRADASRAPLEILGPPRRSVSMPHNRMASVAAYSSESSIDDSRERPAWNNSTTVIQILRDCLVDHGWSPGQTSELPLVEGPAGQLERRPLDLGVRWWR
ncbi:MAG TPA: hypothetical protein DGG94_16795 [Micromonosporaceae bacterium]|nr:hypothetical protein [Micromonosporaceae bacterium]HCU51430.1 hypothetical protein [Micromonosporaceae bacterium]